MVPPPQTKEGGKRDWGGKTGVGRRRRGKGAEPFVRFSIFTQMIKTFAWKIDFQKNFPLAPVDAFEPPISYTSDHKIAQKKIKILRKSGLF